MDEFSEIADFLLKDRRTAGLLNDTDALLAEIGCLVALAPASPQLGQLFAGALANHVSADFIETALIHAIGYLGILPTQTAYELLNVTVDRLGYIKPIHIFPEIPKDREERVDLGTTLYGRFDPQRAEEQGKKFADISPVYYPRAMEISGLTLRSTMIPLRQRQIMTVAMLSCRGIEPQLRFHLGVALKNGVTKEELTGILLFVQVYAGMPRANIAALIARAVLLEVEINP
jgi:4-carboxymuconolactone decarboxylase